jgi:hypothetical protein
MNAKELRNLTEISQAMLDKEVSAAVSRAIEVMRSDAKAGRYSSIDPICNEDRHLTERIYSILKKKGFTVKLVSCGRNETETIVLW